MDFFSPLYFILFIVYQKLISYNSPQIHSYLKLIGGFLKKFNSIFVVCSLLVLCLSLCACGQPEAVTQQTPVTQSPPTATLNPIATPEPTFTPALTLTPLPTPTEKSNLYIVKNGDTVWNISEEFGIPMSFIALQNGLINPDEIYSDQIIILPESSVTPPDISETDKLIVVALSLQKVFVYEGGRVINEFLVSTGLPETPTVQGRFSIWLKYESTGMSGPGYDLPNVLWTMYFYKGYGLHGTYWHNNFGQPMSHGCVNLRDEDAKWLFDWAPLGTSVIVLP